MWPVLDVAALGYLSKTPVNPNVALSFRSLELFHRIRLRKPSFSMEAFTKVVADYYNVSTAYASITMSILHS